MGNKEKNEKLTYEIYEVLTEDYRARCSDKWLWYVLLKRRGYDHMEIEQILFNTEDDIPSFDSVSRLRRKIQNAYPDLRANDTVEQGRAENEMYWHSYGRRRKVKAKADQLTSCM